MPDRLANDSYFDEVLRAATASGQWPDREPTPGKDAATLVRIAQEHDTRQRRGRRLAARLIGPCPPVIPRWAATASAGVVVMALIAAIAGTHAAVPRPQPPIADGFGGPPILALPAQGGVARPRLQAMSNAVAAHGDQPPPGAYTLIATRSWAAEITAAGQATFRDETLCRRADGSARLTIVSLGPWSAAPTPAPSAVDGVRTLTYGPGEYTVPVPAPDPQPEILGGQIVGQDRSRSARGVIQTIAEMYRYHVVNSAQRAAILRVLADTDGLLDLGLTRDRLGRAAVAISIDSLSAGVSYRDLLLLDPNTGILLGYEQELRSKPARADVRVPAVASYVTYLTATRVDSCVD